MTYSQDENFTIEFDDFFKFPLKIEPKDNEEKMHYCIFFTK